ncbi:MAG TPA: hypothetical protein DCS89_19575 [Gammaproteobacteria bacterium]|nr:hypothetical protein [Gammaproteobacteria bacterium]HAT29225.1 hypothetical protein [Gammaproteobacteria bacterium]|tara:strand:+ start:5978 stop:6916 length:939 start_codon:yes stop_codon:yes gene_type:complete
MQQLPKSLVSFIVGLLVVFSLSVQAQPSDQPRFLSLTPEGGLPIIPVLEGWIANADGTVSFSFGFFNRNEEAVDIPLGANNYIEPAKWNGLQPTHFPAGRATGAFSITVPGDEKEIDVWWNLVGSDGEALKVPGRWGGAALELDFIVPRPQGSMQPQVGIGADGNLVAGISAHRADYPGGAVQAGTPVAVSVNVSDPSPRDTSDPRFAEPLELGVAFHQWQGPGRIEFSRHESTVVEENPYEESDRRSRAFREPAENEVMIRGGSGVATVYAIFSEPGEYIISTKVDNFAAPESSLGDQCCWSNVFQRITVR